jgi:hypothetical protein
MPESHRRQPTCFPCLGEGKLIASMLLEGVDLDVLRDVAITGERLAHMIM